MVKLLHGAIYYYTADRITYQYHFGRVIHLRLPLGNTGFLKV